MNILVTGGAGYIGSVCAEQLVEAGHRITVYDNLSEGRANAVEPAAELVVGDLLDGDALRAVMLRVRPDAVVHCAASALVGESMRDPGKYFRENVAGGIQLLDTMRAAGARRLVFSSTCAVYGSVAGERVREDAPLQPANPYGESKLLFERMLPWHRTAWGLEFVSLRFFNVAGATARHGENRRVETHLIPCVLQAAARGEAVALLGADYATPDGTCVRDFVHVADIARAHVLALENSVGSGCFNLGSGRGYSVREVVECCRRVTQRAIPISEEPRRPGDPPQLVADVEKAKRELGWSATRDLEDMVRSAWTWRCARSASESEQVEPDLRAGCSACEQR